MPTPKVMKLVDPGYTTEMECKVCGNRHYGVWNPDTWHFVYGAWQCSHRCKLATKTEPAYNGWTKKFVED
jgi:hypothetical protein